MFLNWFNTSEEEAFAQTLADMVIAGFPGNERKNAKKSLLARAKLIDNIFSKASEYQKEKKPNFYKKAKLGNVFRWKLLENDFDTEFVDDITHQILVSMK